MSSKEHVHVWKHVQYPTPEEYNKVCKRLVEKYPNLRDTIGNGKYYVRLK